MYEVQNQGIQNKRIGVKLPEEPQKYKQLFEEKPIGSGFGNDSFIATPIPPEAMEGTPSNSVDQQKTGSLLNKLTLRNLTRLSLTSMPRRIISYILTYAQHQ